MAWTYDPTTSAGRVRLLCFDTRQANPIFTDAEIAAFLDLNGANVRRAAAQALETIAVQQALILKVITNRGISTDGARLAAELRELAKDLRAQSRRDMVPVPLAGGVSKADKAAAEQDDDRVRPSITRRSQEYPGVGVGGQPDTSGIIEGGGL